MTPATLRDRLVIELVFGLTRNDQFNSLSYVDLTDKLPKIWLFYQILAVLGLEIPNLNVWHSCDVFYPKGRSKLLFSLCNMLSTS